jgi:hypothetical protein
VVADELAGALELVDELLLEGARLAFVVAVAGDAGEVADAGVDGQALAQADRRRGLRDAALGRAAKPAAAPRANDWARECEVVEAAPDAGAPDLPRRPLAVGASRSTCSGSTDA